MSTTVWLATCLRQSFCVGVLVLEIVLNVRNSLVLKKKVYIFFSDLNVNILYNSVAVAAILGGP